MARGALVVSIDQGGHATRAIAFDGEGRQVASSSRDVAERREGEDRVEQDAREVAASARGALSDLAGALGARAGDVAAAALATQRSSVVCWDSFTGEPLSPVLSWQDRRAAAWLARFAADAPDVRARTGLPLSPHYGASKMRWCLEHLDGVKQAVRDGRLGVGPLSSYLIASLVEGRPSLADPANASRTLLWNLDRGDWDDDLLWRFGVPRELLPRCVPTRHPCGPIPFGGREIPLVAVTGDQSAVPLAWGRPAPDAAYVNLGTGAFVQRIAPGRPRETDGLLAGVLMQEAAGRLLHTLEGTVNGAGSALRWAATALGIPHLERDLSGWLEEVHDPPLFLNGVSGLGAPFWVADFPSRFVGEGDAPARAVAVAESVAFLLCENLARMERLAGPVARLVATGGLSRLDGLCQRLADLAGVPVERPVEVEATARGAAFLAAGCPARWPDPGTPDRFAPRPDPALSARHDLWRREMARALGEGGRRATRT